MPTRVASVFSCAPPLTMRVITWRTRTVFASKHIKLDDSFGQAVKRLSYRDGGSPFHLPHECLNPGDEDIPGIVLKGVLPAPGT
jgi:hypothetical protein